MTHTSPLHRLTWCRSPLAWGWAWGWQWGWALPVSTPQECRLSCSQTTCLHRHRSSPVDHLGRLTHNLQNTWAPAGFRPCHRPLKVSLSSKDHSSPRGNPSNRYILISSSSSQRSIRRTSNHHKPRNIINPSNNKCSHTRRNNSSSSTNNSTNNNTNNSNSSSSSSSNWFNTKRRHNLRHIFTITTSKPTRDTGLCPPLPPPRPSCKPCSTNYTTCPN
mmetsp:Transcript_49275/g.107029  ORF Transcript_49275/g.107029 Transcript_49275/m.107029 type:complete len:218 (+) Transcript_49275:587-1240(+)